jgi:hypothetical protein|tara:strand:+ start:245 stop:508 length:264 start_codon:yes stop_codon:yes gene_type:complete
MLMKKTEVIQINIQRGDKDKLCPTTAYNNENDEKDNNIVLRTKNLRNLGGNLPTDPAVAFMHIAKTNGQDEVRRVHLEAAPSHINSK